MGPPRVSSKSERVPGINLIMEKPAFTKAIARGSMGTCSIHPRYKRFNHRQNMIAVTVGPKVAITQPRQPVALSATDKTCTLV